MDARTRRTLKSLYTEMEDNYTEMVHNGVEEALSHVSNALAVLGERKHELQVLWRMHTSQVPSESQCEHQPCDCVVDETKEYVLGTGAQALEAFKKFVRTCCREDVYFSNEFWNGNVVEYSYVYSPKHMAVKRYWDTCGNDNVFSDPLCFTEILIQLERVKMTTL